MIRVKFYNLRKSVLRNVALSVIFVLMMMTFLHAFRLNLQKKEFAALITFCIHDVLQLLKINTCAFYSSIFPARLQVNAFCLYPSAYLVSFSTIEQYPLATEFHSTFHLKLSDMSFFAWCHNYASYRNDQPGVVEGDEVYLKCKLVLWQI
ncbi:hypothetical protein T02_3124 [Trichinella nativa]|uniref:Uncharacterized protein n=1 Tax=Trichinella nativa TaxID=6335 RepID=A0A0V1KXJ1_9BILA|nr:hypothetical protein T02_3124 [Trichinella nativa]